MMELAYRAYWTTPMYLSWATRLDSAAAGMVHRKKRSKRAKKGAHRDQTLLPCDGDDGVVAEGTPCGGVYEQVDVLVDYERGRGLLKEDVQQLFLEKLLEGVESEATQFAFDEVGDILQDAYELKGRSPGNSSSKEDLHDGLELNVAIPGLPPADEGDQAREWEFLSRPIPTGISAGWTQVTSYDLFDAPGD